MLHLFYIYAECVPEDSLIPRNVRGITHVADREWYCAMESECSAAAARADLVACGIDRYHVRRVCTVPAGVDASVYESGTYVHLLHMSEVSRHLAARELGVRKITHASRRRWYCAIEADGSADTLLRSCRVRHSAHVMASVPVDDFKNVHDYMYAFSAPLATMEEVADAAAEISRDACDVYSSPYGNGVYGVGRACAPQHRIREAIGALPGATVTIYRPTGDDARRALSDFSAHFQKHA